MYEYRYALGENCCWALLGLKGLRDCSKFWVRITGLKNAIRDTLSLVPRRSLLGQSWTLPWAVTSLRDTRRSLARSSPDFARTTGQERTPRDYCRLGYSKTWGHGIFHISRKSNKQKYIYFSRIKIKPFPRRTGKRKYLFIPGGGGRGLFISSRYKIVHDTDAKLWQFRWRKLAFSKNDAPKLTWISYSRLFDLLYSNNGERSGCHLTPSLRTVNIN